MLQQSQLSEIALVERIAGAVPRPLLLPVRIAIFSLWHWGQEFAFGREQDESAYWRARALTSGGQTGVLWGNAEYVRLFRERQRAILERYVAPLPPGARVLDVCCGVGTLTRMIHEMRPDLAVCGIDFPEMVQVARSCGEPEGISYVGAAAEDYFVGEGAYDLVVSSGSYGVIRVPDRLRRALENGFRMARPDGTVLMMEPFHRWNFLARGRAKIDVRGVAQIAESCGLRLAERSDFLFWPYRDLYSNRRLPADLVRRRFEQGEKLLQRLGPNVWSDYKVLAFRGGA